MYAYANYISCANIWHYTDDNTAFEHDFALFTAITGLQELVASTSQFKEARLFTIWTFGHVRHLSA